MDKKTHKASIIDTDEEMIAMMHMLLEQEGYDVSDLNLFEAETKKMDIIAYIIEQNPEIIFWGVRPAKREMSIVENAYKSQNCKDRRVILIVADKKLFEDLAKRYPVELLQKPFEINHLSAILRKDITCEPNNELRFGQEKERHF